MRTLLLVLSLLLIGCSHKNCTVIPKPPEGCPKGYVQVDASNPDGTWNCILDEPEKGCTDPVNGKKQQRSRSNRTRGHPLTRLQNQGELQS